MILRQAQDRLFGEKAAELAGFASALLGWRPQEFWSSTPTELETAFGVAGGSSPHMERADMERLARLFPDNRGT